MSKCMYHLSSAAEKLISKNQRDSSLNDSIEGSSKAAQEKTDKLNIYEHMTDEAALQCIQRALLLLKTHLDTFKRRYERLIFFIFILP